MKLSKASTLALGLILNLVVSSGSHAVPIPFYIDSTQNLDEPIREPESSQGSADFIGDQLRAELAAGLFDSVLGKITSNYEPGALSPDIISIKVAALIGKADFAAARKEMSYFDKEKSISEQAALLIGSMYREAGRSVDALKICQLGLTGNIRSPKLLFMMGNIYDSMGQTSTALVYYERSAELSESEESVPTRALVESIANSNMKLKKLGEAKNAFANDMDTQSESVVRAITLAKFHASRYEYEKALQLLEVAAVFSDAPALFILKAQVLNLAGNPELAIEQLAELKRVSPSSYPVVGVEMTESLSHLLTNTPEKSLAAMKRMGFSAKRPSNLELTFGTISVSMGDPQAATEALRRAPMPFPEIADIGSLQAHLDSPSLGPVFGLAYFCLDQGYYQQAIEIANEGLAKHPDNIFLHFMLAEAYRQNGQYELAVSEFKKLTEIMPESFSFRFLLAKIYEEAGMDEQALAGYAALSKERPDFLLTQLSYGNLLEHLGNWEKAREVYEWSLNFKPDSVPLLMALGWALTHLEDADALAPVLRTLETNKETNPGQLRHLEGWAAYQQNDRSKAVKLLDQALAETLGSPALFYHLGMAYDATGEKQKANNLLEQASLFPEQVGRYRK